MKTIQEIMSLEDTARIYTLLTSRKPPFKIPLEITEKEYDPYKHKVMNPYIRKKKTIQVKTDKVDHITGKPIYKEKKVERCRVAVPMQRVIVERSVGFLFSIPVEYKQTEDSEEKVSTTIDEVKKILKGNKIQYFDKKLARTLFRAKECAELWYFVLDEKGKPKEMRVKLLSPINGDMLYPHFDAYDRMDGFARKYTTCDEDNRTLTHFDVYTDKYVYYYENDGSGMKLTGSPKLHGFTKIPIIYYRQEESEWTPVQPAIERVEDLLSNWGDTNDYFGSPSYFYKGKMEGFAEKGEQGRVYQGTGDADMKVLSWDSSPTSITGELANLINIIFSYTQTPDISFENMKTLGSNTSGTAIKLMFTDPHMKANVKIELFGEMFTRRFNLVTNGYSTSLATIPESVLNAISIEPVFKPYMPKNELEEVQIISTSTNGRATMSQEEGVRQNPRVSNPDAVLKQLKNEKAEELVESAFGESE